jgi:hypothetical protein
MISPSRKAAFAVSITLALTGIAGAAHAQGFGPTGAQAVLSEPPAGKGQIIFTASRCSP